MHNHSHVLIDSHVHMHTYLHTLKHTFIQSHGHTPHIHKYIDIISQTQSTYSVHTHSHALTHEFSHVPEFGPWREHFKAACVPIALGQGCRASPSAAGIGFLQYLTSSFGA